MTRPSVSVIINTCNRGYHLKRLLDILSRQSYENFEVVVVNGPSTDNTDKILDQYQEIIKAESCPENNLCMSRNIGVKAASGEILAFIDDDAVPEDPFWIEEAVKPFADPQVGAVGGLAKRMNGWLEFAYGITSIWGENQTVRSGRGPYEILKDDFFNRTQGNNAFFRMRAVAEIGGFDAYYQYYADETDLCFRIIKAGYRIVHLDNANVYHEAAKGINRKSAYHLNWDVIGRSLGYYVIKSTQDNAAGKQEKMKRVYAAAEGWIKDFRQAKAEKKISAEDYDSFVKMLSNGLEQGIADGYAVERQLDFTIAPEQERFKKFDKGFSKKFLNICMLCEDDVVHPIGGVAVYTHMMAKKFVEMGHHVHIISPGEEITWNNVSGIDIYTVPPQDFTCSELENKPVCSRVLNFSYDAFNLSQRLKAIFSLDILEAPIWDCHGLVSAYLEKDIPVITRLQTPLKMVINTVHLRQDADLMLLAQMEEAVLKRSAAIIAISDCIRQTVEELYALQFQQPVYKNYLGINPTPLAAPSRKEDGKLIVFFVGRLERRKGIENILEAAPYLLEKYPNLEFHLAGDFEIWDEVLDAPFRHHFLQQHKNAPWLDRVHFLGKISDDGREQEFADCDIFVSPSLYESFGIIFIEAMRYGKPVIGGKVGGMQEIIVDGETGLLSVPGDTQSFQGCLDRLLQDASLRERMGEAGRKRLETVFTDQIMCEESIRIYREVIGAAQKQKKGTGRDE